MQSAFTEDWANFFANAQAQSGSDLDQRANSLQRQIRDNGVTYNVYADSEGPQRPWSLDLFPLIIDAPSWRHIEAGIQQRMRLLESVMADVYGPQTFLTQGLLPPALVHGHPGYLRPMHGVQPVGGMHLHVAAFDLAHGPDGNWWVVGQRCQAPSGLGYLLENRLAVSREFPQAFQALRVQRLAGTYRAHRVLFTAQLIGGDMTFEQVWLIRGKTAHVWTFADTAADFQKHVGTFERMLDTLVVQ